MAKDWKEQRRLRAWDLFNNGWKQSDIAEALGVTAGAASQWLSIARQQGAEALQAKKHPGPARRLSPEQDRQLVELLKQSPTAHGFLGEVWTTGRVGDLIKRTFGISYHTDHVGRILHRLGFSVQKPRLRARQGNPKAVAEWTEQRWPAVKKPQKRKGTR